ncbi:hypothetical protein N7481_009401 [Penicillium waksmanii]|uniref:uncharacterized protein n=1 Tax=Penicillium waksmanii TaxID=69791 RepID=UPI002546F171|nr:uncharacterized protein N7481_009401 [Penicillium waksmanii]KAJ5975694.1 hypothetical protein N7481_009401 [Penicillium waksmanii]
MASRPVDRLEGQMPRKAGHLVPIDPDNIKVEIWSTSRRLLESIAQQGPQRDSKTNIYALTVFAQRLGYSRLIIADDMTKRQLLGIPRRTHERCTQDLDMDTLLPTRLAGTEGATRCI